MRIPREADVIKKTITSEGRRFVFDGRTMILELTPENSPQDDTSAISSPARLHEERSGVADGADKHPLDRLTLIVSNACNLSCRYCYAKGGGYYSPGLIMDARLALSAVNYAANKFSLIKHINFFGGEPTLNEEAVELVCRYCLYLKDRGIMPMPPSFGLTTNGYTLSPRLLRILKNFNFTVTISLDGPKEVHDRLRLDRNDCGTYDRVVKNVDRIVDAGLTPEFECTYTSEQYRAGLTVIDLMDFFYDNFGGTTLHCPPVIAKPQDPWYVPLDLAAQLYRNAVIYSLDNLAAGRPVTISYASRLLRSLTTGRPITHYCPAGRAALTINADGYVYACFMLMHDKRYSLGSIGDQRREHKEIDCLLTNSDKWSNPTCCSCWAQSLCFGCLGEDLAREGQGINRSTLSGRSGSCDLKRAIIEAFLTSIAALYLKDAPEQSAWPPIEVRSR